MKLKILGLAAGAALLGLTATTASAGTDIYVGLELGTPVVVERRPVYYYETYEPAPVVYYERHYVHEPRYEVREVRHGRHDHGRRHGHYKAHKHKHRHDH
jgi:hypothetical protein